MASSPTRRLVLLRHAKSAWPDLPDHDRPLAGRGRDDAPAMGRWLRETGCIPDLVWCSSARRATQTWQLAAAELGADPPVSYEDRLYGAPGSELADLVRQAPEETMTLLLVGHNPGLQELALMLATDADGGSAVAGGDAEGADGGSAGAFARAAAKFPTAAIAVLEFGGSWRELSAGGARLVHFAVPRDVRR
jgi:phosphohistidine phosphatase